MCDKPLVCQDQDPIIFDGYNQDEQRLTRVTCPVWRHWGVSRLLEGYQTEALIALTGGVDEHAVILQLSAAFRTQNQVALFGVQ